MEKLLDRCESTNHLLRYRLTGEKPKEAFYWVVVNYDTYKHSKVKVLADIVEAHPDVSNQLNDLVLLNCFEQLMQRLSKRNEGVSPGEMKWVSLYVKDKEVRIKIEQMIYWNLLLGSDHWDKIRKSYEWTISEEDRRKLAESFLADKKFGARRKMEIAQELGLPDDVWKRQYLRRLLWDRHYDQAATLNASDADDVIIEVIISNLEACYFRDATEIAERFLPHKPDIVKEIEEIQQKLQ